MEETSRSFFLALLSTLLKYQSLHAKQITNKAWSEKWDIFFLLYFSKKSYITTFNFTIVNITILNIAIVILTILNITIVIITNLNITIVIITILSITIVIVTVVNITIVLSPFLSSPL